MKSKSPLTFRPKIENDEHDDDDDEDGNCSDSDDESYSNSRSKEEGSFINDHSARNFSASRGSPEASKYSERARKHQQLVKSFHYQVMHGNDLPMHRAQFLEAIVRVAHTLHCSGGQRSQHCSCNEEICSGNHCFNIFRGRSEPVPKSMGLFGSG